MSADALDGRARAGRDQCAALDRRQHQPEREPADRGAMSAGNLIRAVENRRWQRSACPERQLPFGLAGATGRVIFDRTRDLVSVRMTL